MRKARRAVLDRDRRIHAESKERDCVEQGQTYSRGRQGGRLRETRTEISVWLTKRVAAWDKDRHICALDKDGKQRMIKTTI